MSGDGCAAGTPPQPFDPIIVDAYEGDDERVHLHWEKLCAAGPPWHGAIIKATQGRYYSGGAWFQSNWRQIRDVGRHANRPHDWLRGAYHYLDLAIDPILQASYFIGVIERAGGFAPSDIIAVDVERAGQRASISAAQAIDSVSKFSEAIAARTGHYTVLYGGSYLRELGIRERMGCRYLWMARYSAYLSRSVYERMGWDGDSLMMWQYAGITGSGQVQSALRTPAGELYPTSAPGIGDLDCSAFVLPGGLNALIAG